MWKCGKCGRMGKNIFLSRFLENFNIYSFTRIQEYILTPVYENPSADTIKYNALRKGLLKYCELDTMFMVLIWEYFNQI